ncbi:MAG: domain containing protein [Myxococcales bacterium]|nr:domain containing protein [Myxococcales bacterium]
MSARVPLTFRIFKGERLLREETLALGVIKIGKVASAHLRIDDESVSRMHAILEIDPSGTVHLIDLGSTRGTFINGQKVNKAKLQSGDSITVGDVNVQLTIGAVATAAPPAVAMSGSPRSAGPMSGAVLSGSPMSGAAMSGSPMSSAAMSGSPMSSAAMSGSPTSSTAMSGSPMPGIRPPAMPVTAWAVQAPAVPFSASSATALYDAEQIDDASGAKAIEIAAMLGDSVIGVKHCIDPKSGKISPRTWGTFGAGVACVLMSAIAFYLSVRNAAFNKGALDAWVRIAHKPAYSYRPHLLGAGYDWLAFGGLALGLVMLSMALVRMRNEKRSPFYRIGTAPGVELPLEHAPTPSFPLVAPSGDDFVFNYGAGIEGEMIVDGRSTKLSDLAASGRARPSLSTAGAIEVPIPARARIRARAGQTTFLVSAVTQPRRHVAPLLAGLESRTLTYFAGSVAAHLGILLLLQQIPNEEGSANIEMTTGEPTAINTSNTEKEDVPPEKDPQDGQSGDTQGAATAMALDEGQAGTTKSTNTDSHMRVKNNQVDPQLARAQAVEEARTAGFLGETSALNGDKFAALTSTGNISSGFDDSNVYGALDGHEGEGARYFGYGRSQFGAGGGCTIQPCGLIGTSRGYNTIGTGTKVGDGWGGPGHGHGFRNHDGGVPLPPKLGEATGSGDLDKATIRRYIKQNIEKFSYCYSKELLAHPNIEGTVVAAFFISPTGIVQGSTATGFDANVSGCVAGVVSGIAFPRPHGGGVQVNYPFTFHTPDAK